VRIEPAFVVHVRAQNAGFIRLADPFSAGRGAIGKNVEKGELLATIARQPQLTLAAVDGGAIGAGAEGAAVHGHGHLLSRLSRGYLSGGTLVAIIGVSPCVLLQPILFAAAFQPWLDRPRHRDSTYTPALAMPKLRRLELIGAG
jgi:hypothetical protein